MTDEWFVARDGRAGGPVPFAELTAMRADGRLSPDGMVRSGAAGEWVTAAAVPGLAGPVAPPAAGWEYLWDGKPTGPVAFDQLARMVGSGFLTPDAMVRPAGGEWVSAGAVAGPAGPAAPSASSPASPGTASPPVLGRSAAAALMVWLAVATLVLTAAVAAGAGVPAWAVGAVYVVGSVGWFYTGGRAVWAGTLAGFGGRLHRRPVAYRLAGLGLLWIGVGVLVGGVNRFAAAPARPGPSAPTGPTAADMAGDRFRAFGKPRVYHRPGLEDEAERLGNALREVGYFDDEQPADVRLDRRADGWAVGFLLHADAIAQPARVNCFRMGIGPYVAAVALPGAPVEIDLCSTPYVPAMTVPIAPSERTGAGPGVSVYFPVSARDDAARVATRLRGTGEEAVARLGKRYYVRTDGGRTVVTPWDRTVTAEKAADPAVRSTFRGMAGWFRDGMGGRPVRIEVMSDAWEPVLSADSPPTSSPTRTVVTKP